MLGSAAATLNVLTAAHGRGESENSRRFLLDNHHQVIDFVELLRGTIGGVSVLAGEAANEAPRSDTATVAHPFQRAALASMSTPLLEQLTMAASNTIGLTER